jgi:hypothetical protein
MWQNQEHVEATSVGEGFLTVAGKTQFQAFIESWDLAAT